MVAERHPLSVRAFEEQRWDVIPGAESAAAFAERIGRALERIVSAHRDQRVAVFSHGATIGEIMRQASGSRPFAFLGADNGSITHLVAADGRWMIRRFNDTAHLERTFTLVPEPLT
jgi:probable phosphoglycerate mutase